MKKLKIHLALILVVIMFSTVFPTKAFGEPFYGPQEKEKLEVNETKEKRKKEPRILQEIVEKRESNIKHYLKDDGTSEAVVYPQPVHYLEDGKWKDISNNLSDAESDIDDDNLQLENPKNESKIVNETKVERAKDAFENKANDFKVKIAKNTKSSKLVSVKKGKYEIYWNLPNAYNVKAQKVETDTKVIDELIERVVDEEIEKDKALKDATAEEKSEVKKIKVENEKKKTLINISSKVEFLDVYPKVDLQYETIGSRVKENIVINDKIESPVFKFNLYVKNLIPKLDKDNNIVFYDNQDASKAIYKINAPYMYDANYEFSSNIKVSLSKNKNGYELGIIPNEEWINSGERIYPITIDPPVNTSTDVNDIMDTFVCKNDTENKYANIALHVGKNSVCGQTRSFIKFNKLPALRSGDMIINAYLKLNYLLINDKYTSNMGGQINVHKVQEDWISDKSHQLSWSNYPKYDEKIEDYQIVDNSGGLIFNITGIAKSWYNSNANYGLMLNNQNEEAGDTYFASSDYTDSSGDIKSTLTARPVATIQYVNYSGLESYWTYHSASAGRAGTGYVNDYNGNLVFVHDDLSMNGNRMPITINHVFNSNDKYINGSDGETKLGIGWRLNLSQKITPRTFNNEQWYEYINEDGNKNYFYYDTSKKQWKDQSNPDLTLSLGYNYGASSTGYCITDKKDNKLIFTSTGYLYKMRDSNNNELTLDYTGAILKSIKDGAGRVTKLDINQWGYVVGITDPANRYTKFGYYNDQLTSITYPDGKKTTYEYDSNKNLVSAANYDGLKLTYSYYGISPYRVKSVSQGNTDGTQGGNLSIAYGNNETTFTDVKGRKNVYQFNDYGNTISVKDNDGSAQYYKYYHYDDKTSKDNNKNNKLAFESKLQKTTINYLWNSNAEASNSWYISNGNGSTGTSIYTAEDKYYGKQSLKVTKTNNVSQQLFYQGAALKPGQAYTLSGYIKTNNVSNNNGEGAVLYIGYLDRNGAWKTAYTKYVNGTKDWDRYEVNFTLPQDFPASNNVYVHAGIVEETGTAYFDGIQIEDGPIANRYNLLENGDFRGSYDNGWTRYQCTGSDGTVYLDKDKEANYPEELDRSCYRLTGDANLNKTVYQSLNISGKAGDSYVASGWAKGNSIKLKDTLGRYFAIDITLNYTDGSKQYFVIPFNEDSNEWQYISDAVVAQRDYSSIDYSIIYFKNANDAYFDGLRLYKENFGQSYNYDDNGNIKSTVDLSKQNSSFVYDDTNNNLLSTTNARGSKFQYTYDGNHNVKTATSAENVVYSFSYDSYGNPLTSQVGGNNLSIQSSAEYTASGNYIKSLTDSSGNKISYNYNETKGTLDSVTDPVGNTTTYNYDPQLDRLNSVSKTGEGQTITNSYGYENDRIKTITHNGFNYIFGYDSLGNNTTVAVGDKNLITNQYETTTGKLLKSIYGNGQTVNNIYDSSDRVIGKAYNGATMFNYKYDASGNIGYSDDLVNGVNYRYIYDNADRLVKTQDSKGNMLTYSYDLNNNLNGLNDIIGSNSFTTNYEYDHDNKLKSVVYNRPTFKNPTVESFMLNGSTAGNKGTNPISQNVVFEKNESNKSVLAAYEGTTNLIATNSSFKNELSGWTADDWSNSTGKARAIHGGLDEAIGNANCIELYDSDGLNNGSATNALVYQYVNLPSALTQPTDYTLSAYTERIGSTQPILCIRCFDSNDNEISGTYWINTKQIEENQWTRVSEKYTLPAGTKKINIVLRAGVKDNDLVRFDDVQFEANDIPTAYTSDKTSGTKLLYNLGINKKSGTMGAWIKTKKPGTIRYIFASETNDNQFLNLMIDKDDYAKLYIGKYGVEWTKIAQSASIIDPNKWYCIAVAWNYNGTSLDCKLYINNEEITGSSTSIQDFSNSITALGSNGAGNYQLNGDIEQFFYSPQALNANEITNMHTTGYGNTISYRYDTLSRIVNRVINTGQSSFATNYSYISGNTSNSTTTKIDTIDNNGDKISYIYDKNGNIKTITHDGQTITYYYNEFNELIREDNQVLNKTIKYSYDAGGNIQNKVEYEFTTGAPSAALNTVSYTYGDPNWKDKLTNFNGKEITYDGIGNPLTYNGYTYTWELGRQLSGISGNGQTISYKYNDEGIRTQKTVNGVTTNYHLVGNKVTYEENGTDNVYYTYDSNNDLVSINLNGVEYYYIRNAQGDIIGLFDKTGATVASYTYDSWGKLISIKDSSGTDITNNTSSVGYKNPYRYRGYRYDSETGLYYLQSRYYNPEWGRFINADGLVGKTGDLIGHNLFAYCKNNPVNMVDHDGDFPRFGVRSLAEDLITIAIFFVVAILSINTLTYLPIKSNISTNTGGGKVNVNKSSSIASSKSTSVSSTQSKTKNERPKRYQYWEASRKKGGGILVGTPLNIEQAKFRVLTGKDVYAVSDFHAKSLAIAASGGYEGPEKHPWDITNKHHYHLKGRLGGHIFFN